MVPFLGTILRPFDKLRTTDGTAMSNGVWNKGRKPKVLTERSRQAGERLEVFLVNVVATIAPAHPAAWILVEARGNDFEGEGDDFDPWFGSHLSDGFTGGADDEAAAVETFGMIHDHDELFVFGGADAGDLLVVGLASWGFVEPTGVGGEGAEHQLCTERAQASGGFGDLTIKADHRAEFESVSTCFDGSDMEV